MNVPSRTLEQNAYGKEPKGTLKSFPTPDPERNKMLTKKTSIIILNYVEKRLQHLSRVDIKCSPKTGP